MRLRLGIDLDGVVADFTTGWIDRYNAEFGDDLRPEEALTWGAPRELTHFASMTEFWQWARTCCDGRRAEGRGRDQGGHGRGQQ